MIVRFTNDFRLQYRKADVRIRSKTDNCLRIFKKNPNDLQLKNHKLKREWVGHRSINIAPDFRVIYKERKLADETIIYFVAIGTHKQLYEQKKKNWVNKN